MKIRKLSKLQKVILIVIASWENEFGDGIDKRLIKRWEVTNRVFIFAGKENFTKYYSQVMTKSINSLQKRGLIKRIGSSLSTTKDGKYIAQDCLEKIASELRERTNWEKEKITSSVDIRKWYSLDNNDKKKTKTIYRFDKESLSKKKTGKKPSAARYRIFHVGELDIISFSGKTKGIILPNKIVKRYNLEEKDIVKVYSYNNDNRIVLPFQELIKRGGSLTYTIPFWAFQGKFKDYWQLDEKGKIDVDIEIKYHVYKDDIEKGKVLVVSRSSVKKMDEREFNIAVKLLDEWKEENQL
jgi:hypothetical protein